MSSNLTTPNPPSIFKMSAEKIKLSVSAYGSKLATVEATKRYALQSKAWLHPLSG